MKNSANVVYGTILAIVCVIAYVTIGILVPEDKAMPQNLVIFVTPFIAALLLSGPLDNIKQTTDTIQKNTNGMLTRHVDEVATRAAETAYINVNTNTTGMPGIPLESENIENGR